MSSKRTFFNCITLPFVFLQITDQFYSIVKQLTSISNTSFAIKETKLNKTEVFVCVTQKEREITKMKPLYYYNNIVVFRGKGYPVIVVQFKKAPFIVESLCTMCHTPSNAPCAYTSVFVLLFAHMNSMNSLLKFWKSLHVI